MNRMPLGADVTPPRGHDPSVLYPIPRKPYSSAMHGYDLWRCYELSWLNTRGRPEVGILELVYPVESRHIVESKSLKLFLGGLAFERIASVKDAEGLIRHDLEGILETPWISVQVLGRDRFSEMHCAHGPAGISLDDLDVEVQAYSRDADLLSTGAGEAEETLSTDLLRTLCPITGQPDWATVLVSYHGRVMDHAGLLRYLCSYRDHQGFAEDVCSQIFTDIMERCAPGMLRVTCFYTRRGGVDITALRCTDEVAPGDILRIRLVRQ